MKKIWSYLWLGLYLLCTGMSLIENAVGAMSVALMILKILFFVPPVMLLFNAITANDKKMVKLIRTLSIVSLSVTLVMILVSTTITFFYAAGVVQPYWVNLSYYLMLILSTPLYCGTVKALSLFLWACLLFATFVKFPDLKKGK